MSVGITPEGGVANAGDESSADVRWLPVAPTADALALLVSAAPGAAAIGALASIDPASLDAEARVLYLQAWERQHAWLCAQQQVAIAAVAGPEPLGVDDWSREEVAVGLGLSVRSAQHRIHVARMLTEHLTATMAQLSAGRISWRHALVMVDECARLSRDQRAAVEAAVLDRAPSQTVAQFARTVRRAVLVAAPLFEKIARTDAAKSRDVVVVPEPDGMASVVATMPAADARALFLAVDALARGRYAAAGGRAAGLRIGGCRVDALVALADEALSRRSLPRARGRPVNVQVVIDLPTLIGLRDDPAHLVGYGPIAAQTARELARDASWQRLVTDPCTGRALDLGRRAYRPSAALAELIAARDRTCRFPGCCRAAEYCDIDHVEPDAQGGRTDGANLMLLCRRHHRLKTRKRWEVRRDGAGAVTWRSPAGQVVTVPPRNQLDP
jgi:hypothetical protein